MKRIYIVSRYIGVSNDLNRFHFIGYVDGVRIMKVLVRGGGFNLNCDYVLALENIRSHEGVLYGNLVKSKIIF